ncbi:MAG: fructose-specific PTS transporter subunit EIIC [Capsulimonadaceae bacterium]|nr:fructose-specific PTS transporter subunit EIIC [Capsulimonadaceae bacterium]
MKTNIAVSISCSTSAHARMAAEALQADASLKDCILAIEIHGAGQPGTLLSRSEIDAANVAVLVGGPVELEGRFASKAVYRTRASEAIQHPGAVLGAALALVEKPATPDAPMTITAQAVEGKHIVAITSCPTGIAHTFMAAEALKKAAAALGHEIHVETQGSVGAKNTLTEEDIAAADAVVIAADTNVDLARFAGKAVYSTGTKAAMHHGKDVIAAALSEAAASQSMGLSLAGNVEKIKAERSASRTGIYKHLMTGVSYMLPVVVAGGLSIALAFAIGGAGAHIQHPAIVNALEKIGGAAFGLFVAILSAYVAYSIADRPGIAPGLIGGILAQSLGAGFLGGIVAGFLAGYIVKFMAEHIHLPANLEGLKPVLILPFIGSIIVGLLMIFVIAPPVGIALTSVTHWLNGMRTSNAIVIGALLGAMMAFDMGGPVNKAAYTFSTALLLSHVNAPMAAVMAAGMTPPLGLALATFLFRNRFDEEEREAGSAAFVLGLAFITEGAIPFASRDPLRVIPSLMIGSAIAGAISMASGVQSLVPHGGVFALLIPGAVTHVATYLIAIAAGACVTAGALFILKRPVVIAEPMTATLATASLASSLSKG